MEADGLFFLARLDAPEAHCSDTSRAIRRCSAPIMSPLRHAHHRLLCLQRDVAPIPSTPLTCGPIPGRPVGRLPTLDNKPTPTTSPGPAVRMVREPSTPAGMAPVRGTTGSSPSRSPSSTCGRCRARSRGRSSRSPSDTGSRRTRQPPPGYYLEPTILTGITPDNPAVDLEFFGSVACFCGSQTGTSESGSQLWQSLQRAGAGPAKTQSTSMRPRT